MPKAVVIDGRLCAARSAVVSVFDRGFLYGDGVFEVLRTLRGTPHLLSRHIERLKDGASQLGITCPSAADIEAHVSQAIAAHGEAESFLRLILTRGQMRTGIASEGESHPTFVVIAEDLVLPTTEARARGLTMATVVASTPSPDVPLPLIKSLNYLEHVVALRTAKSRGADDALLVTPTGFVLEGASSNFFSVSGDELFTPPVLGHVLPGVTREAILRLAPTLGLRVREVPVPVADLVRADECFLTSSIRGVMRVASVDGQILRDAGVTARFSELLWAGL